MKIYRLPDNVMNKMAITKILSIYPLIIMALIAAFLIINKLENNEFAQNSDLQLIFLAVVFFILVGGFFTSKKTIIDILKQTKFIINDGIIEKSIPNGKNIKISFREVRNYTISTKRILLKTKNKQLLIPNTLTNFDELESILKSNIQTGIIYYDTKFKINQTVLSTVAAAGMLILLVSFFLVDSKQNKLLMGIPLLLVLIYAIVAISKNKDEPAEVKALVPKVLFFALTLIGYLLYISIWH